MHVVAAVQVAPGLRIHPRKLAITQVEAQDANGAPRSCRPQAGVGRVIFGPFCMRRRSHESCRFRMIGACPDAAFRSAQLPHSCARDTDQLVELALFGIPDAAAQKNPGAKS